MKKIQKKNRNQLLETVRDTIYEVLEEELDRKITAVKTGKMKKIAETRARKVRNNKVLKSLQEKKQKIKKLYRDILEKENEVKKSK